MKKYVIGLDYGSDSVRAVLIDAQFGNEIASSVHWYARWKEGKFCNPAINQFRQHPLDHLEGLEKTIKCVVEKSEVAPKSVVGISIDTTGSSPIPVTKDGTPLSLTPGYEENPNAMMILWKDHTAIAEADEINDLSVSWGGTDYTKYEGGIYSSEWFWAKILHIIREDDSIRENAYSWLEHCDYLTNVLIGNKDLTKLKRSRTAAGHKAMWHEEWGGLPAKEYLEKLDPYLADLRDNLYEETYTAEQVAGNLSKEWAKKLGLTTNTVVTVGTFDAHSGAVGAGVQENSLVRVMGTSTCDIMVAPDAVIGSDCVKGICGQVDGSVIPGMVGLEAGQSSFGDVLAWFKEVLMWPVDNLLKTSNNLTDEKKQELIDEIDNKLISTLALQAEQIPLTDALPTALDWVNGRRTPDANQSLKSAIMDLNLGTKAPRIFKSLVHAICFGSKKIVDRFEEEGVVIDKVIGIGGVARKSPYIMQTLANVLNRPIIISSSDYAPALGAAIYASVAAGLYPNVLEASKNLASDYEAEYYPQTESVALLEKYMKRYDALGKFMEGQIEK